MPKFLFSVSALDLAETVEELPNLPEITQLPDFHQISKSLSI